jgi:hypothetical protein
MADNYLSRLKGQGGISSTPFAQNRERMLAIEAQQEAALVQRRMAEEQAMMAAMAPQGTPNDNLPTLEQYRAQMTAMDPKVPQMRQAPSEPSIWGSVPGFGLSNFLQSLGLSRAQPDVQLDDRLGRSTGSMAMNNQRLRQRLDDFERERIRSGMMTPRNQ